MVEKEHLIDLVGISKEFDGVQVLKNINLYIRKKEFITLLGPSGCGKTTTLRIIGGFETPSEGQVLFGGQDISALPPYKRRVNTVFQKYALFPHLNVYDNIAFGLKLKKLPKKQIAEKVGQMLELVNLKGYEKRHVDALSGGQQQKTAICRALYRDSPIVILDEPTAALDPVAEYEIYKHFNKLVGGKTVIGLKGAQRGFCCVAENAVRRKRASACTPQRKLQKLHRRPDRAKLQNLHIIKPPFLIALLGCYGYAYLWCRSLIHI